MRRNKDQLENRRVQKQHQLIKYWTTHENFVTMYDRVYPAMVDAKVATPMDESDYYFINRYGTLVTTQEEAADRQIKHHICHPQYVIFVDQLGTDINQMDDGNNGGQSYIRIKEMTTTLLLSKDLGRFTFMRMASATGEPLLCICILAVKNLSVTDVKVFNYRVSILYDSSKTME